MKRLLYFSLVLFLNYNVFAQIPGGVPGGIPTIPQIPQGIPQIPQLPGGIPGGGLPPGIPPPPQEFPAETPDLPSINPSLGGGSGGDSNPVVEKLESGNVIPGIYYSDPFGITGALIIYNPSPEEFRSTFVQVEGGLNNVALKGGIAEVAPVGFAWSAGALVTTIFNQTSDFRGSFFPNEIWTGVEISAMFSLAVIRLSYLTNIAEGDIPEEEEDLASDGNRVLLSVGIGLF